LQLNCILNNLKSFLKIGRAIQQAANPIPRARAPLPAETDMTREAGASRPAPKVPADIFNQQLKGTDK